MSKSRLFREDESKHNNYLGVYSNRKLGERINEIESSFLIMDEEEKFQNLVNISESRNQPYHRWARYREGFSGNLVTELINRSSLNPDKHYVCDPMCGSGSTLLAAVQMGFDALGMDINPFAVDLANAKVAHYSASELAKIDNFIIRLSAGKIRCSKKGWKSLKECEKYFASDNLEALKLIIDAVCTVANHQARQLLFVAWLSSLEDCSERKKDGNGLATRSSPIKDVRFYYSNKVKMFLEDIKRHPIPDSTYGNASKVSAFCPEDVIRTFSSRTKKELGAIIFSPPYANSFDYFESYKIELLAGYMDGTALRGARAEAIRNYRKGYSKPLIAKDWLIEQLCAEIANRTPDKEAVAGKIDNRTRLVPNLIIGYFEDMKRVIHALANSLKRGAKCHIIVDQSAYLGVIVPTDIILAEFAQELGFTVDHLSYCRKAKTSGQQLNKYPYLGKMLRESIISLTKK
jgi:site-specific DNA-methyltransferase (adenine-specific)